MSAVTWVCVTVVIAVAAIGGILSAPGAVAAKVAWVSVLAVAVLAQWVAWVAAPPMAVSIRVAMTFIAQWVFAAATEKVAWTWATAGRAQVVTTCTLAFSPLMVVLMVTAPIVEESGDDPAIMAFSTRFSIGAIMSAIVIVLFVPFLVILLPEALVSVMPANTNIALAANFFTHIAHAAEAGDVAAVRAWLDAGGQVNKEVPEAAAVATPQLNYSPTLLDIAARRGHEGLVSLLLQRGGESIVDFTALLNAANIGHKRVVDLLLQHSAGVNVQTRKGDTALMYAAAQGLEQAADLLLQRGAGWRLQNSDGRSALMAAAEMGHERVVDLMLQHSGSPIYTGIDQQDSFGLTALMLAARFNHPAVVLRLLRAGADMALRSDHKTALQVAKESGHAECVEVFKTHLAEVAARPSNAPSAEVGGARAAGTGASAAASARSGEGGAEAEPGSWVVPQEVAVAAARHNNALVLAWLDRRGGRIDATFECSGMTLLMITMANGNKGLAEALLQRGADASLQTDSGTTALMLAAMNGQEQLVELALRHGVEMNQRNGGSGGTALMDAAYRGYERIVDMLIRHGAEINLQASKGDTALILAALYNYPGIVRKLLRAGADMTLRSRNPRRRGQEGIDVTRRIKTDQTALQLAKDEGHTECVRALEEHAAAEAAAEKAAAEATRSAEAARERAAAEAEAARHAAALLAEEATERAREENKRGKKKKGKKGKGGAGPSPELEAAGPQHLAELGVALRDESARLDQGERWAAGEASDSSLQPAHDQAAGPAESEGAAESEVPPELQCPLSFEVMEDPVICASGQTYERSAIEKWFAMGKRTDPMSGAVLEHTHLVPNVAVRSMCRRHSSASS